MNDPTGTRPNKKKKKLGSNHSTKNLFKGEVQHGHNSEQIKDMKAGGKNLIEVLNTAIRRDTTPSNFTAFFKLWVEKESSIAEGKWVRSSVKDRRR